MIVTTRHGNRAVETRDAFAATSNIPRASADGATYGGRYASVEAIVGLPAVMAGIRLLAETIGAMPIGIYEGRGANKKLTEGTPQEALFGQGGKPHAQVTPFAFKAFIIAALQGWGGSYTLKLKAGDGEVMELAPLNSARVKPKVKDGELLFEVRDGSSTEMLSRSDILYVPGILFDSPLIGLSPLAIHRRALGAALDAEEWAGRFWANDATPAGALSVDASLKKPQVDEMRESWLSRHQGLPGSHNVAVMYGDTTYETIGVNPSDAQWVEGQRFNVEQVGRILRIPRSKLDGGEVATGKDTAPSSPEDNRDFHILSLSPWTTRVVEAFHGDNDIFPDKALYPGFIPSELLKPDAKTQAEAAHRLRQAGIATSNELRPDFGLGPHPDGDELQMTPVGGAPNIGGPDPAPPDNGGTN